MFQRIAERETQLVAAHADRRQRIARMRSEAVGRTSETFDELRNGQGVREELTYVGHHNRSQIPSDHHRRNDGEEDEDCTGIGSEPEGMAHLGVQ